MAPRSNIRGASQLRRLMRRMPAAVQGEIVVELNLAARALTTEMQRRAPSKTGALRGGISSKVFTRTLRLQAGLIGAKRARQRLFYGLIQDLGRKAQTVTAKRRTKAGTIATYRMRVRAMAPKRFVTGSFSVIRARVQKNLKQIWARALSRVAGGGE